jgi:hypothetical protein
VPSEAGEGQLKLARLFERLGDASFGFILFCAHAAVSYSRLSLGPISTAAGASMMALGGQMAQGRAIAVAARAHEPPEPAAENSGAS